jgi:nucleotide-binding universal stress UspA family protein
LNRSIHPRLKSRGILQHFHKQGESIMKDPVIIPLDGSTLAEQALPLGVSIARTIGQPVRLLRVQPVPDLPITLPSGETMPVDEQVKILLSDAQSYLHQVTERIEKMNITVSSDAVVGNAGEVIADTADKSKSSFIVMATHGRSGISRWTLGSVADRVLHLTKCPLILLRPHEIDKVELQILPELKRILVPLDGSALAESVLPCAKELARNYGAELLLFRVPISPPPALERREASKMEAAHRESAYRQEAQAYLARIVAELGEHGFNARYELGEKRVEEAILAFATDVGAGLIAMTTHARVRLNRVIRGSVTDRIVRAGEVPVLVIRPETETT